MKKLFIVALLALGLNGFAQKQTAAEKQLTKMTTDLSLTAEQQEQIKPIIEEQVAIRKDSKENPDNMEANKEKMKDLSKKMVTLLTPEQKKLRKELMEKEKAAKEAAKAAKEAAAAGQ